MNTETTVPATEETPSAPVTEQPEQAQVEQTPEQPEEKKPDDPKPPKWFRQTIARKDQQIGEYRQQLRALQEQLQRQQPQESTDEGSQPQQIDPQAIQRQVMTAAQRIAEQQRTTEAFQRKVLSEGSKADPEFPAKLQTLAEVGDWDEATMQMVLDADKPAALFQHLANNLDEAAELLALPLGRRAREIARLELKLEQQSKPAPSQAPKPLTPVRAAAASTDLRDDLPMDEWVRRRNAQKRGA